MRSTIVTLLAIVASVVITACVTPEPGQSTRRRMAPPDSNCRFESYCQVIVPNDEPASASKR